jgi:hypothetical protein
LIIEEKKKWCLHILVLNARQSMKWTAHNKMTSKIIIVDKCLKRLRCANCNALIKEKYALINDIPICYCCYEYHNLGLLNDITQEEKERMIFLSQNWGDI